ncbi:MAG: DJ-1/PfpI family protein [Candidatus Heimdallarchaeota archaeon]
MNTYFLLYDSFSGFELSFPAFVLRNTNLVTVGLEKGPIVSEEKLNQLNEKGKIIASVCGGPVLFSNTTILENKRYVVGGDHKLPENWMKPFTTGTLVNEDVVVDGNLITAKMEAIVSFAIAIGKELNIFANEEEEKRTFKMLQNIR